MNRIQEASWRLALSEGSPVARQRAAARGPQRQTTQPALQRLIATLRRKSPPPAG